MELVAVSNEQIVDPEIRERNAASSRCAYTQHFLATEVGSEVGLLFIDLLPTNERFVIYEIFVPTAIRRRGFGRRLLQEAEDMARNLGYKSALLVPKSLDKAFSQRALEEWYAKNGYIPARELGQWRRRQRVGSIGNDKRSCVEPTAVNYAQVQFSEVLVVR